MISIYIDVENLCCTSIEKLICYIRKQWKIKISILHYIEINSICYTFAVIVYLSLSLLQIYPENGTQHLLRLHQYLYEFLSWYYYIIVREYCRPRMMSIIIYIVLSKLHTIHNYWIYQNNCDSYFSNENHYFL